MTVKQAKDLQASLDKFGLCQPLVVNADGTLIGGHQRYETLKKLGYEEVEVYAPDNQLTEKETEELALRLNKNTGEWDFDILANEFELDALFEVGFDLPDLGIDDKPIIDQEKEEPKDCKMTITADLTSMREIEDKIAPIIKDYPGAIYRVKG